MLITLLGQRNGKLAAARFTMAAALQSFTNVGKGLAVAIVAGGLAAQVSPFVHETFGLIAARAVPRPWTLLTCAFVQSNVFSVSGWPALHCQLELLPLAATATQLCESLLRAVPGLRGSRALPGAHRRANLRVP